MKEFQESLPDGFYATVNKNVLTIENKRQGHKWLKCTTLS